jgi:hypothetical protein
MPLYGAPDGLPPGFETSPHPGHWHLDHIAQPDDRPGDFTVAGRPELSITACFHTPGSLTGEVERAGFAGLAVCGVAGTWSAAAAGAGRSAAARTDLVRSRLRVTQPSLIGFSAV